MADLSSEDKHGRVLNFKDHRVRVVDIDGKPWFVASDVGDALTIYNPRRLIRDNLKEDEKRSFKLHNKRGMPPVVISQSGLYKLVMRSDKERAKEFQDWVTRHVLPAIQKDGMYVKGEEKIDLTDDDALDRMTELVLEEGAP